MSERTMAIFVLLIMGAVLALVGTLLVEQERKQEKLSQDMDEIEKRIEALGDLNQENEILLRMVRELKTENKELQEQVRDLERWIDQWDIEINEVTYYAPLDNAAIEGMCFSGCPNTTASGAQVEIGRTIAAGPSVPFGTLVLVEGHGVYEVQDRGGLIMTAD